MDNETQSHVSLENVLRLSELYYSPEAIRERCIAYALEERKGAGYCPLPEDAEAIYQYIAGK